MCVLQFTSQLSRNSQKTKFCGMVTFAVVVVVVVVVPVLVIVLVACLFECLFQREDRSKRENNFYFIFILF